MMRVVPRDIPDRTQLRSLVITALTVLAGTTHPQQMQEATAYRVHGSFMQVQGFGHGGCADFNWPS